MSEGDQKDVLPEPKGPEQPAVDASPENAPATLEPEVHAVGERVGMFGVTGSGDTSGYGGLVQPIVFPGPAKRPFEGWHDEAPRVHKAIIAAAEARAADMIVMVTHGRGAFGEFLFGSQTKAVLAESQIPLLVLH